MLHGGGHCDLRCIVCDCAAPPSTAAEIERALGAGGSRLLVRGPTESSPATADLVRRARERGFSEIVLRTNALACREPAGAEALARLGADGVLVPLFSETAATHDRLAGRERALIDSLSGLRHLARAGLNIEIEIPLLSARVQKAAEIVRLVHRVVPVLRAVRFFVPHGVPKLLAPPAWSSPTQGLADAISACRALGVRTRLTAADAIPLCALHAHPDLLDAYAFNPKARAPRQHGAVYAAACESCAVRPQCTGSAPSYHQAHGDAGIVPYAQRPSLMYEQRTTRRRDWTPAQRAAASRSEILVLRPTVNCNQDCTFCSANETSANVWANHAEMLRAIARAARRRIDRVSFSGGEPTLSKHLVEYVRSASRLGVPKVEIISNAVLLDRQEKVQALAAAGLTHAFISLHAHTEELSRQTTQKVGDFPRTVQGIKHLLAAGVRTVINHVINARNYPYLVSFVEFARREFGGKVKISFAFVTPQFKGLENIELMPRLSDVMPHLKRAMYRAVDIGQPVNVGSRQGIPFCFLDEFRAWSDGLKLANSALSEDSFQKQRAPGCDDCRFSDYCTGLWKPYVARYGLDELRPVAGPKLTAADLEAMEALAMQREWGVPMSFDDVPPGLRETHLEQHAAASVESAVELPAAAAFVPQRTRPLRIAMLGSGRQARRLARNALQVPGLSIDAVASPHAPEADLQDFGDCPAYRDAAAAIDDMRPEAVIIAAATEAHVQLARLAIERRTPALLEKPIATDPDQARALRDAAIEAGACVVPAHNSLYSPGLGLVLAVPLSHPQVSYTWRRTQRSNDTMRLWSRSYLYETAYHLLVVVGRAAGGGRGTVSKASFRGDATPEHVRIELNYPDGTAEVIMDFAAAGEEDALLRRDRDNPAVEYLWRRQGRVTSVRGVPGAQHFEASGNDTQHMLANFRDVVLGKATPGATLDEAIDTMQTARAVVDALDQAGAPFDRPNAPRHVHSQQLQSIR